MSFYTYSVIGVTPKGEKVTVKEDGKYSYYGDFLDKDRAEAAGKAGVKSGKFITYFVNSSNNQ